MMVVARRVGMAAASRREFGGGGRLGNAARATEAPLLSFRRGKVGGRNTHPPPPPPGAPRPQTPTQTPPPAPAPGAAGPTPRPQPGPAAADRGATAARSSSPGGRADADAVVGPPSPVPDARTVSGRRAPHSPCDSASSRIIAAAFSPI